MLLRKSPQPRRQGVHVQEHDLRPARERAFQAQSALGLGRVPPSAAFADFFAAAVLRSRLFRVREGGRDGIVYLLGAFGEEGAGRAVGDVGFCCLFEDG